MGLARPALPYFCATALDGACLRGKCEADPELGSRLAAYKVPVSWLFTSAFPLTAKGKVRKDVLLRQKSH